MQAVDVNPATEFGQFVASLRASLAQALGDDSLQIEALSRRGEGYSWETYLVRTRRAGDGTSDEPLVERFAVKREPTAGLLGSYDVRREVELLRTVRFDVGCPVPRVIAWHDGVAGARGYYAMEMVEGVVPMPWDVRKIIADAPTRRSLGAEIAAIMARLHAKDIRELRIDGMAPPADGNVTGALEARKWYDVYVAYKAVHVPVIDLAFAWLAHRAGSVSGRVSLVHNDLRIGNIIVRDDRVAAVLDWETAGFTDPSADLAKFNLPTFRGRSDLASGLIPWQEFLQAYEAAIGWRPDEDAIRFWTVLEIVKAAVGALRGAHYFQSGQTDDIRYANMGWQAHHSIKWLIELYEGGKWGK